MNAPEKNMYCELAAVDVSRYVEKKNDLSYLSWAWAVDQLLRRDPTATWEFSWFDDPSGGRTPYCAMPVGYMVFCTVRAFGVQRTAQLPVLDYKNKPIATPSAWDINTSMQRCLAKAIALHGLGINLYAGEDLPLAVSDAADGFAKDLRGARDVNDLNEVAAHIRDFVEQYPQFRQRLGAAYESRKNELTGTKPEPAKGVAGLKKTLAAKE